MIFLGRGAGVRGGGDGVRCLDGGALSDFRAPAAVAFVSCLESWEDCGGAVWPGVVWGAEGPRVAAAVWLEPEKGRVHKAGRD